MDKPRICEVLGVEPGEEFMFRGHTYVIRNSELCMVTALGAIGCQWVACGMINNSDEIERLPQNSREKYLTELFSKASPEAQAMVIRALGGDT